MESERLEYFLDGMAISLQRIANSLEQIAEAMKPRSCTADGDAMAKPFPWGDDRIPCRIQSHQNWRNERPKTFGELISLGRSSIASNKKYRGIGCGSVAALDPIFRDNGLIDAWKAS